MIELLAVMAILSLLVAMSFGFVHGAKHHSARARTRSDLALLAQALERYKVVYGDYPQTGAASQALASGGPGIQETDAQALLFNALAGVYGPADFNVRLNGPMCVEAAALRTEIPLDAATFGAAQGDPPVKPATANAFVDGWGHRYLYYYKAAAPPGPAAANAWRLPGYVLYSAGPDGRETPPDPATGRVMSTTATTGVDADNLYSNP